MKLLDRFFRRKERDKLAILLSLVNENSQPNLNKLNILVRNIDIMALNLKSFGYELARQLNTALPTDRETFARQMPLVSKASTQADMESDWVAHWCRELQISVIYHRKLWEMGYLLQSIFSSGDLRAGARCLGFGCGTEPLPSYFAANGIEVTATDLPSEDDRAQLWSATGQHASTLDRAFHAHLVNRGIFDRNVRFRPIDMNAIPDDLRGFDFCWSTCALEHLGSIEKGLNFIENSLRTLRPGGTAIHTMEFNINPDGPTIDNWPTVLFQRKHLERLAERLHRQGHVVAPFDFDTGNKPLDHFIDLPPWHDGTLEQISRGLGQPFHLKVAADGFISTCFGMTVTKAA